ncbi:MAG: Hpt domain-containing protein [Nitrosomonadales bacterium]|nr:Hpt domain-containing protein [Nitrosomonadales bacterium]
MEIRDYLAMETVQDEMDPELLSLFLEEADELYPQIAQALQAWRMQPDDAQLGRKLQRSLHTFKGSARMAGAMRIGELLHLMEDRVTETAQRSPAFRDELQDMLAHVGELVGQVRSGVAAENSTATTEESTEFQTLFSSIGKRLYRIVRQTGKELGKKANLELRGTELELECSMLEKMTAPFEHLLRNAMAHGLESPEQRESAGKPPVGEICLSLRRKPNEIVFEFSDDGAGLDVEALRRRAAELDLPQIGAVHSDAEAMQLIFTPGLSTAEQVTETAGRGVGMDVVRSEIAALGGCIEVTSERGKGTCFIMRLPLVT